MITQFEQTDITNVDVHQNEIITQDGILGITEATESLKFLDFEVNSWKHAEPKGDLFLKINFNLAQVNTQFYRRVYSLMTALGDVGGLTEAVLLIAAVILSPSYYKI